MSGVLTAEGRPENLLRPGVAFLELRAGECKFPLGEKDEPPERFCGAPALEGSPYCPRCGAIAYRRQDKRAVRLAAWVARSG